MIKTRIKDSVIPLILTAFLFSPLASRADTMTSQNWSIDSGHIGTGDISSSAASQNYNVEPLNGSTNSSSSDHDNHDHDDNDSKHKKNTVTATEIATSPGVKLISPGDNANQSSPLPEQNSANNTKKIIGNNWPWVDVFVIFVLILSAILIGVKRFRQKIAKFLYAAKSAVVSRVAKVSQWIKRNKNI